MPVLHGVRMRGLVGPHERHVNLAYMRELVANTSGTLLPVPPS